jgi:hypothetical protein
MDRLNEILPHITQSKCALFIGAGLSKIAGCYDWDSIVEEMVNKIPITDKPLNPSDILGKFGNEELIGLCHKASIKNGKENIFWGIARRATMFNPELFQSKYIPVARSIKKIKPTPVIITTNIDNCLEYTREFDLNQIFYKENHFLEENLNGSAIYHIHGYIELFEESLLTRQRYIQRYQQEIFRDFLIKLFSRYSVIFIGYSLRDQEIKDAIFQAKEKNQNKKHFLLIPSEDNLTESQKAVFLGLFGIVTIVYGRRDQLYNTLDNWVTKNFEKANQENISESSYV